MKELKRNLLWDYAIIALCVLMALLLTGCAGVQTVSAAAPDDAAADIQIIDQTDASAATADAENLAAAFAAMGISLTGTAILAFGADLVKHIFRRKRT